MTARSRSHGHVALVFLAAMISVSCSRCGSGSTSDAGTSAANWNWLQGRIPSDKSKPVPGGTLVVRSMSEPAGLNFLDDRSHDAWTSRMTRNLVFECLLEIDPRTYELKPQLAKAFQESADHRTTTFQLRDDVHFSDGSALTSADVIAVLDAVKNDKLPTATIRGDFAELESWKAIDPLTVELQWNNRSPLTLRNLAKLPIYSARQLAGDWADLSAKPIGTGPYAIDSWTRGSSLMLKKTASWWGGTVNLDAIEFRIVKDHTVAGTMFSQGAFDLMTNIQPAQWRAIEPVVPENEIVQKRFSRIRSTDNSYSFIAWNEARPLFRRRAVRVAIEGVYPELLIRDQIDLGLEIPTTCPFFIEGKGCEPSEKRAQLKPEEAKQMLLNDGFVDSDNDGTLEFKGAPARFTFLMPAASVRLGKIAPLMQERLKAIGIDMQIEKVDAATLSSRMAARDFDAVSRVWTEFDAEQDVYANFHSSQRDAGSNFIDFSDAEVDRLLNELRTTWTADQRHALERKLHRRLHDEAPYLIMSARQSLDAASTSVHGLRPSVLWYDLRRVWKTPSTP